METTQGRKDITFPRQDIFKDANELAFERSFTSSRVELLNPVTAQNSKILSEQIAALWLETIQEIEAIGGRSRHIPEEGRTLDEDLQDAIVSIATQVWSLTTPQYPNGTRVYNMISTWVQICCELGSRAIAQFSIHSRLELEKSHDAQGM